MVTDRILVTYASRAGSTAGVAEAIGQTLAASGLPVDVMPMQDVIDLTPYGAVVAGSAIQDGRWLPEAMAFIHSFQFELQNRPFAAFLVCMTLAMKNEKAREAVPNWLNPVRTLVHPVSEGYFAGKLNIRTVPTLRQRLMFRVSVALGVWEARDHRDWDAIRAWAAALPHKLVPQPA
jgi:menaquinone-dependent protoporphyrinogen oxidase